MMTMRLAATQLSASNTSLLRLWRFAWVIAVSLGFASHVAARAADLGVVDGGGGDGPRDIRRFEQWLGCPVQQILVYPERNSWRQIAKPEQAMRRFAILRKPALWSIGMIPPGSTLQQAATGAYNGFYVSAARALARAHRHPDGTIRIRPGWELNGDWSPWAAKGHEQAYIETYRNIVDSFRSVSSRFRFEWNINYGRDMDPAKAYPGDQYVDVIGIDFYWMPQYQGSDPDHAFAAIRDDRYGLNYIQAFAKAHHKPVAISEWGIQGDNAGPFIEQVRHWIETNGIIYHNYWNSDADYPGRLSGGRWPRSGAAFRQAFCRQP